jgi:16S rRNA U516 pseudouridylate synthase RsuA-like enzyme
MRVRNASVRRMFAALGYMVLELKRIRFGSLKLNNLKKVKPGNLQPLKVKALKRK